MSTVRRARTGRARCGAAIAVALAVLLAGAGAGDALAVGGIDPPGSGGGAPAATGASATGATGTSAVQRVRACTLFANNAGFGAWCGSGVRGRGRTWRQRLEGKPFVRCRDDAVPRGVRTPPPPSRPAGSWMLETCMVDVDLDTLDGGDDAHTRIRIVWVPTGRAVTVPPHMEWLWDAFTTDYPTPVLSVGPTTTPRVNVPAYFWLAGPSAGTQVREVWDGRRTIRMEAVLRRLRVDPGVPSGPGGLGSPVPAVDCAPGSVPYDPATGPFRQLTDCSFTFRRSSASLPRRAYEVQADATWEVRWIDPAGVVTSLGSFTVGSVQLLPVQEVESVVRVTEGWS